MIDRRDPKKQEKKKKNSLNHNFWTHLKLNNNIKKPSAESMVVFHLAHFFSSLLSFGTMSLECGRPVLKSDEHANTAYPRSGYQIIKERVDVCGLLALILWIDQEIILPKYINFCNKYFKWLSGCDYIFIQISRHSFISSAQRTFVTIVSLLVLSYIFSLRCSIFASFP